MRRPALRGPSPSRGRDPVSYLCAVCSGLCKVGAGGLTWAFRKLVKSSTSCLVPTIGGIKWWYGESGLYSCSMVIKLSMFARSRPAAASPAAGSR